MREIREADLRGLGNGSGTLDGRRRSADTSALRSDEGPDAPPAGRHLGTPRVEADETIGRAIEIRDGVIQNPKILSFQRRSAEFPHDRL